VRNVIPIEWRCQFFSFFKNVKYHTNKKNAKMKFLSLKWAIFEWKSGGRGVWAILSASIIFWEYFERHMVHEIDAFPLMTRFWTYFNLHVVHEIDVYPIVSFDFIEISLKLDFSCFLNIKVSYLFKIYR
jgi:hypothetical protein